MQQYYIDGAFLQRFLGELKAPRFFLIRNNVTKQFVMGGVPFYWRDGSGDSKPGYMDAYLKFDAISPWSIGRYGSVAEYEYKFKVDVVNDKAATSIHSQWYAPVVYPGGSDSNLAQNDTHFNSIPRLGRTFFNGQADTVKERLRREKTFVYIAMFDEVDEGTAMFKAVTRKEDTPIDGKNFLYLNIDSPNTLSSDHYLQLASDLSTEMKKPTRDSLFSNSDMTLFDSTFLRSASDLYRAIIQGDGNHVIYAQADLSVVWQLGPAASRPQPFRLMMQGDGNVVIYDGNNQPRFAASNTPHWVQQIQNSTGPYRLIMQDDKNLVAYDVNGLVVWAAL